MSMGLLVIAIDRDNDLGRKTGIRSPVIGREPNVKAALELNGWPVGPPRSPLLRLNTQMKDELSKILSALPKH